jgi:hypothetical protein
MVRILSALGLVLVTAFPSVVHAQSIPNSIPNLLGSWSLQSELVAQPGRHGPQPSVVNGTSPITITQTATELRIEGARGFFEGTAPVEIYKLDGSKGIYVQNFGDWWRKSETWFRWDGTMLVMRLRVIGGYYSNHSPEQEALDHPHGDNTRIVAVSGDGTTMTVQTTVVSSNATPGQTATQVFRRAGR